MGCFDGGGERLRGCFGVLSLGVLGTCDVTMFRMDKCLDGEENGQERGSRCVSEV